MRTKRAATAPPGSEPEAAARDSRHKPYLPDFWDYPFSPAEAAATLAQFVDGAFDLDDPERARQIVKAWSALSRIVADECGLVPEAAILVHYILMVQLGDEYNEPAEALNDPDLDAAVKVAMFALLRIAGSRSATPSAKHDGSMEASATLRKMAALLDPLGSTDPKTRMRQQLKDIVDWSASDEVNPREEWLDGVEDGDLGALYNVPDEEWRARRATYLREKLGELDPRFALDEATARTLVRLFKHKNGTQRLAANWAWRAGVEGEPEIGESLTGDAPERVVDRYRDAEQKLSTRRRRRKKLA